MAQLQGSFYQRWCLISSTCLLLFPLFYSGHGSLIGNPSDKLCPASEIDCILLGDKFDNCRDECQAAFYVDATGKVNAMTRQQIIYDQAVSQFAGCQSSCAAFASKNQQQTTAPKCQDCSGLADCRAKASYSCSDKLFCSTSTNCTLTISEDKSWSEGVFIGCMSDCTKQAPSEAAKAACKPCSDCLKRVAAPNAKKFSAAGAAATAVSTAAIIIWCFQMVFA